MKCKQLHCQQVWGQLLLKLVYSWDQIKVQIHKTVLSQFPEQPEEIWQAITEIHVMFST